MLTTKIFNHFLRMSALSAIIIAPFYAVQSQAHEYWIEPEKFELSKGENLKASLKNGENFKGYSYSYIKDFTELYTITNQNGTITPDQRTGNRPAFDFKVQENGLHSASFQNKFDRLTFKEFEKFETYAKKQGLDGIVDRHIERGLSKEEIVEEYARSAKALVQVGNIENNSADMNKDQLTGLKYEFVVGENPYALSEENTLPVTLYYEGKPMANKQVQIFRDSLNKGEELEVSILRTDDKGQADITLKGGGRFLLSSVHMFEGDDDPNTDIGEWQSYWASLVFGIKGTQARADNMSK